jgi:hypothetical protein
MEASIPTGGLWETIKTNKIGLIFTFGIFPMIVIGIIWIIVSLKSIDNVQNNWIKYRCHPAVIPIAGFFKDGDGNSIDSGENFDYCKSQGLHSIASFAMEPFQYMFGLVKDILSGIADSVDSLRELFTKIREAIMSLVAGSSNKVANTTSEITTLIGRMRDIFSRLVGSGALMASFTSTMLSTMESVFQLAFSFVTSMIYAVFAMAIILSFIFPEFLAFAISLGAGLGIAYCFDEDTIIKTTAGYKKIKNIKIGDILISEADTESHTVEGVMQFTTVGVSMYKLGDIIVSGYHKVLHNSGWIYVMDHPAATSIKNYNKPTIYCLMTDTNQIPIKNYLFTDYEEVSDQKHIEEIEKIVWGKVMGELYSSGLYKDSLILLNNNSYKPISELNIGDILYNNNVVECIIQLDSYDVDIYNYKGLNLSGYTWINTETSHKGKDGYIWLKDLVYINWIKDKEPVIYQLITSSGDYVVKINDGTIMVRDYIDTHDNSKLEEIEKYVMKVLNN